MTRGAAFLVYDADCSFCVASARWVARRWPPDSPARILAGRDSAEHLGATPLTESELARAVWWVGDTERLEGADAVARALREVGGLAALSGVVIASRPVRGVAGAFYRYVASHRHLIPRWFVSFLQRDEVAR